MNTKSKLIIAFVVLFLTGVVTGVMGTRIVYRNMLAKALVLFAACASLIRGSEAFSLATPAAQHAHRPSHLHARSPDRALTARVASLSLAALDAPLPAEMPADGQLAKRPASFAGCSGRSRLLVLAYLLPCLLADLLVYLIAYLLAYLLNYVRSYLLIYLLTYLLTF